MHGTAGSVECVGEDDHCSFQLEKIVLPCVQYLNEFECSKK
jgi:hypothetical protein